MWTQSKLYLLFIAISLSLASSSTAAPFLRNRDFESPPTNITANSTSPFFQLTPANTIPGWSHKGTVRYVSSGPNISLPGNGHALQLGPGGKINQTIRDHDHSAVQLGPGGKINQTIRDHDHSAVQLGYGYVLSFILVPSSKECFNNLTAVNVSVPEISQVFFLNGHYGKQMWETHGFAFGLEEPFDLIIEKVSTETGTNLTCDPIIDEFHVRRFGYEIWYSDNSLANNGFEEGPGFTRNYSEGILLHQDQDYFSSLLPGWSVLGTINYIDSKHYKVPKGNAAIELLTGDPSGISCNVEYVKNLECRLRFTVADAKDSCLANFTVFARAGTPRIFTSGEIRVQTIKKFTMSSYGTGSLWRYSMRFKANPDQTEVSIYSSKQSQTRDGIFCGPVIDDVNLQCSAAKPNLPFSIKFLCWVLIVLVLKESGLIDKF